MKLKGLFILTIFCLLGFSTSAQIKYVTLSGYVKYEKTGEELISATVFIKELQTTGTITNAYGFCSLTIPEGNYTITAQFLGCQPKSVTMDLS